MSVKQSRRQTPRHSCKFPRANQAVIERLENRQLLDATILARLQPAFGHPYAPATDNIDLSQFFSDPNIDGTVVSFDTTAGTINVALTDSATPITVQNFLTYVNSGAYNNTFFHRSANFETDTGGTPENPADIVQGGGFSATSSNAIVPIPSNGNIQDEYTKELFGDIAGTLAMAKPSQANSANSEFFFNVHDNSQALDTPTTDPNGTITSYTAFGTVLGNGLSVLDTLAALPTFDLSSLNFALNSLPVTGITEAQIAAGNVGSVSRSNLEFINSAKVIPAFTYTVTSDNPALVQPLVNGNTLSFTYGAALSGVANITITASSGDGVTSQSQTFAITVPNPAQPAQGPVANPYTSGDLLHDQTATISPMLDDTDSLSPIDPSELAITTEPAHGQAFVDPTNGDIIYTPQAGFVGTDTLQYTIADVAGNTSAPATATLNVVPDPTKVTIGTPSARDVTFTQPDGTIARITVAAGTAAVAFNIGSLQVGGEFDDSLTLSSSATGLKIASVGKIASGTWNITGPVQTLIVHSAAPAWSLTTQNLVKNLQIDGDLASDIAASAINTLTVTGSIKNATIHTQANWTPDSFQLNKLSVGGTITNSKIIAEGNINSITAKGMTDGTIEAGLNPSALQAGSFPASHTDFTSPGATIRSVKFLKAGPFSNSKIIGGVLQSIQIGIVTTANGGTAFGIAAGVIGSLSAILDSGATLTLTRAELGTAAQLAAYFIANKITGLHDFQINLLP